MGCWIVLGSIKNWATLEYTSFILLRTEPKKVCLSVVLAKCTREIPFLIDDDIDMEFDVPELQTAVKNHSEKAVKLAADFSGVRNYTIHVHGLLDVDLLQYLQLMRLMNFMDGFAWKISQGVILFGNVRHFLPSVQALVSDGGCSGVNSYPNIIAQHSTFCPHTHVNFVTKNHLCFHSVFPHPILFQTRAKVDFICKRINSRHLTGSAICASLKRWPSWYQREIIAQKPLPPRLRGMHFFSHGCL